MEPKDQGPKDPDRYYHRISKALGVSTRIQAMAVKKRKTFKLETKEQTLEKILVS